MTPGPLERIAAALETIAAALTGTPAHAAPTRPRPQRPDTEFAWDTEPEDTAPEPLPEPAPPQERCGFRIEQYIHPLDRHTLIYQVSKQGATLLLTEREGTELAALDDREFTAALAPRLAEVLAERARNGHGLQPSIVRLPQNENTNGELITPEDSP